MRPSLLLVCLCACAAPAPEPPAAPAAAPSYRQVRDPAAGGVVLDDEGRAYAAVTLLYRVDECSGAGGEHYVFAIDEGAGASAAPRLAHGGGHAFYVGLIPGAPVLLDQGLDRPPVRPPRHYVAELQLLPPPEPFPPTAPAPAPLRFPSGWCLDGLPTRVSAAVLAVVPANDLPGARRLLGEVAEGGMPASAVRLQR